MAEPQDTTDPTVLTTEALHREIEGLKGLLETRLDGMEAVWAEKLRGVETRFTLIEQQRVEQKTDTKSAVDAALIAQKEAVREQTIASERAIAKSETATTKQLEGLGTTFTTAVEGLRREIGDLKERLAGGAGQAQRVLTRRTDQRASLGLTLTAATAAVGGLGLLFAIAIGINS